MGSAAGSERLLAFDYGRRRIGVAVGERLTGSARPLTTLTCPDGGPDWQALAALIDEWRPARLVVGLPLNMDGTEHHVSRLARRFARQLEARLGLDVALVDERLTSVEADERLREARRAGRGRRVRRGESDAVAAGVILESYMEQTDEAAR